MGNGLTDAATLEIAKREMTVAEAVAGPRSKLFVTALTTTANVQTEVNQPSEGRALAERAMGIAKTEFPDTLEFANTANALSDACQALGDRNCSLNATEAAIAEERKAGAAQEWDLVGSLSNRSAIRDLAKDPTGAGQDVEEALAIAHRVRPDDPETGILESNAATHFMRTQDFAKAIAHFQSSLQIVEKAYGSDSPMLQSIHGNLAELYTRIGQFELAWQNFKIGLSNQHQTMFNQAWSRAGYARSLAGGGQLQPAIKEALEASRVGRETFVLQARTLPEQQVLNYYQNRPYGLNIALSVVARHPDLVSDDVFQEMARNRALVTEEMARRQRNLNANNDPEVARLLKEMDAARADLLAQERSVQGNKSSADATAQATSRMNTIERALAERSAAIRDDDRATDVRIGDLRRGLPVHSVLISYVAYRRVAVESVDPAHATIPSYVALVMRSGSDRIRVYDLGEAKPIDDLVSAARASADLEAEGGGAGALRNERSYRETAANLRKRIWDPLRAELGDAQLALVVPDGLLNLIPFAGLPDGEGYLVEHGPVIHMLTSERDLVPAEAGEKKKGMLAVGNPSFNLASVPAPPGTLRGGEISCTQFHDLQFPQLPGSAAEVEDIHSSWMRWNHTEKASMLTGDAATRAAFLSQAVNDRVLHIATHAFLLDKSCGNGNPLLHSGLVFAGANKSQVASILTAQQIASLDLSGVDWAVLSACNTGNGELRDGEGVLGLQRAFRVAGARNVVMTLWPVDDDITRRFMHQLYAQRLGQHSAPSDAAWNASRILLRERRAAHQSTHPWYWAGFVSSGTWM
jgi:CHAT domain-containing protein